MKVNTDPELLAALRHNDFEAFIVYEFKQRITPWGSVRPATVSDPFACLVSFRKLQFNHPDVRHATKEMARRWLSKWKFTTEIE